MKPDEDVPCEAVGCDQPATHYISLRCFSPGDLRTEKFAIYAPMPHPLLCEKCARDAHKDDLLTIEVWAALNAGFINQNRTPPNRDDVELVAVEGIPPVKPPALN